MTLLICSFFHLIAIVTQMCVPKLYLRHKIIHFLVDMNYDRSNLIRCIFETELNLIIFLNY